MSKTITDLPNEILLAVFSYLELYDVKYNVANVCSKWFDLSTDSKLWKRLTFETINKTTKTFGVRSWYSTLRFLETTPQLEKISISQGHSADEIIEILSLLNERNSNLREIEFNLDIDQILPGLKNLTAILEKVESLKLNLNSSHAEVFKALADFKNLKSVVFSNANPQHKDFDVFLNNCPKLENLEVADDEFCRTNFSSLMKRKDQFVRLFLKTDNLDESCVKELGTFSKLKSLTLKDGNLTPKKLNEIGKLKFLRSLFLKEEASSDVLSSTMLSDFFRDGKFEQLKELKLHKSRLNDEGALEIRRNLINLTYLEVHTYPKSPTTLTERGLLHILHCKRLENFEFIFDNSENNDWIYKRISYSRHECDVDEDCPLGLDELLHSWEEIQIPID